MLEKIERIPDIVATDQYGTTTAYDVMITHPTGRTAAAHKPLHTAAKGERGKQAGYDAHTRTPHHAAWRGFLATGGALAAEPEVAFFNAQCDVPANTWRRAH